MLMGCASDGAIAGPELEIERAPSDDHCDDQCSDDDNYYDHEAFEEDDERASAQSRAAPAPSSSFVSSAPRLLLGQRPTPPDSDLTYKNIVGRKYTEKELEKYHDVQYTAVKAKFEAQGYALYETRTPKLESFVVKLPTREHVIAHITRKARRKQSKEHQGVLLGPHLEMEPDPLIMWTTRTFISSQKKLYYMYAKEGKALEPRDFVTQWFKDPSARRIDKVLFDPKLEHGLFKIEDTKTGEQEVVWNRWHGWAAAHLPNLDERVLQLLNAEAGAADDAPPPAPSDESDEERRMRLLKQLRRKVKRLARRITNHVLQVWFNGDEALVDYWWDYVAWMLQRPYKPTKVFWMIIGDPGVGKNAILDWVREQLMGSAVTRQPEDPYRVFENYSGDFKSSVIFLQMDEMQLVEKKVVEHIKRLVTADTIDIQQKYKPMQRELNFLNIVATSSQLKSAMPFSEIEQCLVQVQIMPQSPQELNSDYFKKLFEALNDLDVIRHFYDELMTRNLSKYGSADNMQANRPATPFFKLRAELGIEPVAQYMSAVVNQRLFALKPEELQTQIQKCGKVELKQMRKGNPLFEGRGYLNQFYQHYRQFLKTNGFGSTAAEDIKEFKIKATLLLGCSLEASGNNSLSRERIERYGFYCKWYEAREYVLIHYNGLKARLKQRGRYVADAQILGPVFECASDELSIKQLKAKKGAHLPPPLFSEQDGVDEMMMTAGAKQEVERQIERAGKSSACRQLLEEKDLEEAFAKRKKKNGSLSEERIQEREKLVEKILQQPFPFKKGTKTKESASADEEAQALGGEGDASEAAERPKKKKRTPDGRAAQQEDENEEAAQEAGEARGEEKSKKKKRKHGGKAAQEEGEARGEKEEAAAPEAAEIEDRRLRRQR